MSKKSTTRTPGAARRRSSAKAPQRRRNLTIGGVVAAIVVLLGVTLVTGNRDEDQPEVASAGATTLGQALEMLDGSTASLADYRGQPLVVNFFASWCVPCLAEMPGFEWVHQDLDGQVAFLGVNLQDRAEDGRRVVRQTGVTYDIARDPDGSLFQSFVAVAMPTTVFIDADGTIIDLHSGEINAADLAERIDEVLLS